MNSRARRRIEAENHNNKRIMICEIKSLVSNIYSKHRVWIQVNLKGEMDYLDCEVDRLKGILSCETAPVMMVESSRREFARLQLAAIASMAGIGHIDG